MSACDGAFLPPSRHDEEVALPFSFRSGEQVWHAATRNLANSLLVDRSLPAPGLSAASSSAVKAVTKNSGDANQAKDGAKLDAAVQQVGRVHMIICALDYKKTGSPLTCTVDGDNMAELAHLCNARVERLYDEDATVANVSKMIHRVGSQCGPEDHFIFFYAGHGSNLPDQDGDEDDGQDEAFCFVDEYGQTSPDCWLRDDDFAKLVTSSVHRNTKILILADCCHSGTVADINKTIWDGYRVISISGCKDKQTSGDTGKGGIFTHAMLLAVDGLKTREVNSYTAHELYGETLAVDDSVFNSAQDITMQKRPDDKMAWPLVPPGNYIAPMRRAIGTPADSPCQATSFGPAHGSTKSNTAASATSARDPQVHMIICALDYKKTGFPLTCTADGDNMSELAHLCQARVEKLYNDEATVANVSKLIKKVGSQCGPDDCFVFYYAGHGANLPDQDGDEDDGRDEAFCLVDQHGQTSPQCWLRDDDFAELVTSSVHSNTNVLIVADCCHSGTVADVNKPIWEGYRVMSMSGCKDTQTSGDTGQGAIFTHSLLIAIDQFKTRQVRTCSVGELYDETLKVDNAVFKSAQDISLQARPDKGILWPLMPRGQYVAPLRRASTKAIEEVGRDGPLTESKVTDSMPTLLVRPENSQANSDGESVKASSPLKTSSPNKDSAKHNAPTGGALSDSSLVAHRSSRAALAEAPVVSGKACSCFGRSSRHRGGNP